MSRHRKRPAPKHEASGGRRRSAATHARARDVSVAMRRVVVTPTFAAGLGVVIAAGMALPMTKTVISYGGEPPVGGHPCPVKDCVNGSSGDGGTLAGAKPGLPLVTPSPVTPSPGPTAAPTPSRTVVSGGGRPTSGPQPVMQSQTLRQWQSGFIEQITITSPGGPAPANWQLRLSYDQARIIGVWGGQWSPSGGSTVVVTPSAGGGQAGGGNGLGGGGSTGDGHSSGGGGGGGTGDGKLQVVLAVSGGHAGPPSGCSFNGRACRTG